MAEIPDKNIDRTWSSNALNKLSELILDFEAIEAVEV